MRTLFACLFAGLALLSVIAGALVPPRRDAKKVQLVWVSDPNPARKEQIAQFNEMFPDYQLRLDPNNSGSQKIIFQSAANFGPSVFDSYGSANLQNYVEAGVAADVTHLAREMGFDYTKTFKAAWPSFVYQGRQYGFPCNVNANAVWINKGVFRRYGVPLPTSREWTWPEFVRIAKKVTIARKDSRGYACYGCASVNYEELIMQYGGRVFREDGTRCTLDSPEAKAGLRMYFDLIFKHHVMPTPVEMQSMSGEGGWSQGERSMFANGRFAMLFGGRWQLITFRPYYTVSPGEDREALELTALPQPHAPGRKPIVRAAARCALVSADAPNIRDAATFLRYLASPRYNRQLNRSADALPPLVSFARTEEFRTNKSYPQEDFHEVFLEVIAYGVGMETSPFVNPLEVSRILRSEVEAALAERQSPEQALETVARRINELIGRNVSRSKSLKQMYDAARSKSGAQDREP